MNEAALIHRAFSARRTVRNAQSRAIVTSGLNISYGTRLPKGNGGRGLHEYYPKENAKLEDIAQHNVLMRGAACAVSRVQ